MLSLNVKKPLKAVLTAQEGSLESDIWMDTLCNPISKGIEFLVIQNSTIVSYIDFRCMYYNLDDYAFGDTVLLDMDSKRVETYKGRYAST